MYICIYICIYVGEFCFSSESKKKLAGPFFLLSLEKQNSPILAPLIRVEHYR